jgi:hypothetical protein
MRERPVERPLGFQGGSGAACEEAGGAARGAKAGGCVEEVAREVQQVQGEPAWGRGVVVVVCV